MYQIKGKIDSTNALEFEKEIMAAKPTEIDASKLEYISSAGLRVLLKLTKTVGEVNIVNASPEVYEIFDVTGFTSILNVKKALREISVEGKEIIGKGGNGSFAKSEMVVFEYTNITIKPARFSNMMNYFITSEGTNYYNNIWF